MALVNPHDVMWYPIDQPGYQADHPDELAVARELLAASRWMDGDVLPAYAEDFPEVVDRLPEGFGDDLISKPCQRQWRWDQQTASGASTRPTGGPGSGTSTTTCGSTSWPTSRWSTVLAALEASGAVGRHDRRVHLDHGDMCGSR